MAFAQALLLWNRFSGALAFLESVQTKFSALPEFQFALGLAYYGVAQFSDAATTLEGLLRSSPPRKDAIYFWMGNAYQNLDKEKDAETAYDKAIEINPKEPVYYVNVAILLRQEGPEKLDAAIAQLKDGLHYSQDNPYLDLQLALCYESKEDLTDAVSLLEKAVKRDPNLTPAHVALARIYFRLGKKTDANHEKETIKALQQKPGQQEMRSTTLLPDSFDEHP
jgi:Tfp pilus assembly protein PilF